MGSRGSSLDSPGLGSYGGAGGVGDITSFQRQGSGSWSSKTRRWRPSGAPCSSSRLPEQHGRGRELPRQTEGSWTHGREKLELEAKLGNTWRTSRPSRSLESELVLKKDAHASYVHKAEPESHLEGRTEENDFLRNWTKKRSLSCSRISDTSLVLWTAAAPRPQEAFLLRSRPRTGRSESRLPIKEQELRTCWEHRGDLRT
ncbi:Keratin, type II cytoskeletal 8 [Fukomys damarensis]|uniref:Keratin, type II cytoskeletal 8 n=1 Tax=Fukomys damarensis TaxID=885580 RepID=A0A091DXQ7_FUKDA|nr:Keratin, type II cytoskeletal 8 [Fukomys damarensis]